MWKTVIGLIWSLIKTPITYLVAFFAGRASGKNEAKLDSYEESLQALAKAEDAKRTMSHDADSVRDDPFNRDNA